MVISKLLKTNLVDSPILYVIAGPNGIGTAYPNSTMGTEVLKRNS